MKPMWRARHAASARSDRLLISVSPIRIAPRVGRSMPASRFSSVDLPEPDGPISPSKSPSGTLIDTRSRTGISIVSRLYDLVTSRSSIKAISRLQTFHPHHPAIGQPGRRIEGDHLARHRAALHLDLIDPLGAKRHDKARRRSAADHPDDRLAVLLRHRPFRHQHDWRGGSSGHRLAGHRIGRRPWLLIGHARGHLRLHMDVGVENTDTHFDDRLRAI